MKMLFLDIETLPADESSNASLKYLFERKLAKKAKAKTGTEDASSFEDFVAGTSFDGSFGRILCIAYAVDNDPVRVLCNPDNEKKTLEDFWFVAKQCDVFVGHNVMDFDLRFILQRSVILGVEPTWRRFGKRDYKDDRYLSFARYQNVPIFDTMYEWTNWGNGRVGLEHIALAMGIPTPKEGIDGSEVYNFYKAGKVKEICDYCMRDVDVTRKVYKKMTFDRD